MASSTRGGMRVRRLSAVQVAVAMVIGALGVLAPLPRFVEQKAMATETRRPFTAQQPPTTDGSDPGTDVVSVAEDTRDFSLIGVTLDQAPGGPVMVRVALDDEPWGQWEELAFEVKRELAPVPGAPVRSEPDKPAPGVHSEPLWVGEASRYEISMPGAVADDAQVHLVYETTQEVAVAQTAPAGADPARPAILPRSSWGARAPAATPSVARSLQAAIVHHTAGQNSYSSAEVPAILRGVQAYHMDANGWDDIAYNFAVDRFGRIWEARAGGIDRAVIGGHARGFNTGTTGVVVLGNFDTAAPTAAAVRSVSGLLAWKFAVHDVDPRTSVRYRTASGSTKYAPGTVVTMNRIVRHLDVGLTACPGRYLSPYVSSIRTAVNQAWPSLAAPGVAFVGNFVGHGYDDVFLRQPGVLPDQLLGSTGSGFSTVARFGVNDPRYKPRIGDFDGNGYDDFLWYGPGRVPDRIWLSRGNGTFATVVINVSGAYNPVVGDFNRDGRDDIFWYAPGTSSEHLWLATGGGRFQQPGVSQVTGSYRPVAGDFDGDGDDDIMWHGPGRTGDSVWAAQGGRFASRAVSQIAGSYLPEAGDYNGDGRSDIFWYAPGSPTEAVWLGRSDLRFSSPGVAAVRGPYRYARAGNFMGDGRAEVLWYASPGHDSIWWHDSSALFGRSSPANPQLR